MGVKTTVVWDCERCPSTENTDPGVVPEGWMGMAISEPRIDAEDGHLDFTIAQRFTLLCSDCILEIQEQYMYGEEVSELDEPRKKRNAEATPPQDKILADIDAAPVVDDNEKAPVVGESAGAAEESDG